jgi:uncharacterized protein YqiB (DUF1249 family)
VPALRLYDDVTRHDLAHALLDAVERIGSAQDYYRINHASPDQIRQLGELLADWLAGIGVTLG